jgi:Spy/CpxP family protein refolding chaperone
MRNARLCSWAPLLTIVWLGLAGCDNDSSGASAAASATASAPAAAASSVAPAPPPAASSTVAEDDPVDESLRDFHRHHHGGLGTFISMAIDTLGLDETKKAAVTKIQTDLRAKMAPVHDAEHDLFSAIADGIAAGKIDTTKVDAAVEKVATASAGVHAATADAMTQLHDALSPTERAALVDKVKAHWEVWQKVNVEERPGSKDKGSHLAKLTALLGLTPDQVDKINAALSADVPVAPKADPKTEDAHIQAFATAFTADKFDPKSLVPSATAAAGHVARNGGSRLARFYEAVAPVLTPQQRTTLADSIRKHLEDDQVVK